MGHSDVLANARGLSGLNCGLRDILGGAWRFILGSLRVLEPLLSSPGRSAGLSWGTLGGPWEVLGGSLGDPVGDQVRQTLRTPMFQRFVCFHVFLFNVLLIGFFSLFLFSPWGSWSWSWEALGVARASLRVCLVPWEVLGSSWGVLGDSLKVPEGQAHYIYQRF